MTVVRAHRRPDLTLGGWVMPWLAWTVSRSLMLLGVSGALFYRWGFSVPADLHLYFLWAYVFQHGVMPYRDIAVVYPPGILTVLILPAKSLSVFTASFLVAALVADAAVFARLRRLPNRSGSWVWLVGAALAGPVLWARLDIFVALAIVMGLIDAHQGHTVRAGAWFGLGASLKLWPLLLMIPLLVGDRRHRLATLGAGLAPGVLLTAPVVAWGALSPLFSAVQAQAGRGLEIESVFAVPLALARSLGLWHGRPEPGLAFQFAGSAAHTLAVAASVFMAVGVGLWLAGTWRRPRVPLALSTVLLAAILLATGRVLSAQYALWVLAPAAVLGGLGGQDGGAGARQRGLWLWLGLSLVSTQALFPFAYGSVLSGGPAGAVVTCLHAVAVVGLLVSAVKAWLVATPGSDRQGSGGWEASAPLHPEGLFADNSPRMSTRPSPPTTLETAGRR